MKSRLIKLIALTLFAIVIAAGSAMVALGAGTESGTPGEMDYVPGDFTVYDGRDDLTATLGGHSPFSVKLDIKTTDIPPDESDVNYNGRNTTAVQKYDGLKSFIYFNGERYDELDAGVYKFNFHLRNVELYCYDDGYPFKTGDTFLFKKGMYFPLGIADGQLISGYCGRLGSDFSVRRSAGGTWIVVKPAGSELKIAKISTVTEAAAGATKPASLDFEVNFDSEIASTELSDLETNNMYSENIFIGGKSIKAINDSTPAVDNDGEKINTVSLSAYGTGIKVSVVKSTNIVELGKSIEFKVDKKFVSETGYVILEDISRYYIHGIEFWSSIAPYEIVKTEALNIDEVAEFTVIDNGANGSFDITFKQDIADKQYLSYNFHPGHLPTLPDGGYTNTKNIAENLGSSGATESILDNIVIQNKTLRAIWAEQSDIGAKSNMYQIHIISPKLLSIRSAVANLSPLADINVQLKKGLVFYSGAYLDHDVNIKYTVDGEKTSYTVKTETIALTSDKTELVVGENATLSAEVAPIDSTEKVSYVSSDPSVLTVDADGKVTAIKKGTATVKAVSGIIESNAITLTVVVLVESVTVESTTVSIEVGKTSKIIAKVQPTASDAVISYASNNTDVATVAADGTITAVKAGTATITVSAGGKTATVTVTVTAANAGGDNGDTKKAGCGSSLGAMSAIMSIIVLGAAMLFVTLRKKSKN